MPLRSTFALLVVFLAATVAKAGDWPQWRGPEGTGVSEEKGWPLTWGVKENVKWRVALPDRGNSTPVVWGDRVFVTQALEKEGRRTLMCFAKSDGRLLWQSGVTYQEHEPTNGENPYCSSSAATDGAHVVAYFGSSGLYCYDFSGNELWHRETGKVDSWQGSGSSPIIHEGLCYLNAGPGTKAVVLAVDVKTGELVWSAKPPKVVGTAVPGAKSPAAGSGKFDDAMMKADPTGAGGFLGSWSTPVVVRDGGREEVVVVHPGQVSAYEPRTGKEVWVCRGLTDQAFATPVVSDGILVVTGHRVVGGGTRVTGVKLGGEGDVTATHRLWQTDLPKECVGSGVVTGGKVYLVTQFGSVMCLDVKSGKKLAEKRLSGEGSRSGSWSSIVIADGKMMVVNHAGETFVVRPTEELEVLGVNSIGEETTCASPALSDGSVFLRTYKGLWCFGK